MSPRSGRRLRSPAGNRRGSGEVAGRPQSRRSHHGGGTNLAASGRQHRRATPPNAWVSQRSVNRLVKAGCASSNLVSGATHPWVGGCHPRARRQLTIGGGRSVPGSLHGVMYTRGAGVGPGADRDGMEEDGNPPASGAGKTRFDSEHSDLMYPLDGPRRGCAESGAAERRGPLLGRVSQHVCRDSSHIERRDPGGRKAALHGHLRH